MAFLFSMIVTCLVVLSTFAGCSEAVEKSVERKDRSSSYCDVSILGNRGVISSPYYREYDEKDCRYNIVPSVTEIYRTKFYMCEFVVGTDDKKTDCEGNYVKFEDGIRFCGEKTGYTHEASPSCGTFYLDFHVSNSYADANFKIAYCVDCDDWTLVKDLCEE